MKAWVRRKFNEGLQEAEEFEPTFGTPVTQAFGDVASEGTSTSFARSDHRHGMPSLESFVLDLETNTMYLNEMMTLQNATDIQASGASTTFGGLDDTGHLGGYGTVTVVTTAANSAGAFILAMQSTSAATTQQLHPWKRMTIFQARVRPVFTSAQLVSCFAAVGGIRTSTSGRADTITDGVYFYLETDALGVGNWIARATNNTSTTSVDTGKAPVVTGSDVEFQTFRIEYDLDTNEAEFSIGDSTDVDADGNVNMISVASITTNIPPATRKLAGFGAMTTNGTASAVARSLAVDLIAFTGRRVYSE